MAQLNDLLVMGQSILLGHMTLTNPITIDLSGGVNATATSCYGTKTAITIPVTSIKESYLTWGGKHFSADYGPLDAALNSSLGCDRFAFLPSDCILLEYSTNNGTSWVSVENIALEKSLFSTGTELFYIGNNSSTGITKSNYMCRVTVTMQNGNTCYTALNKFMIDVTTQGSEECYCKIDARTQANYNAANQTWDTIVTKATISGWSGWNVINTTALTTWGNTNTQYRQIRFTFGVKTHSSTSQYAGLAIKRIMAFGGVGWATPSNMAKNGHIYSYDSDQNAVFPARVTAPSFNAKSDARLKENFKQFVASEKSILDLPIYKFDFIHGDKNQIGCIAQDLKDICPEIVLSDENGYLSIQESKIVYLLIDEVKKLKEEVK